ncbi:MAG: hypothetical protein IID48_21265 [Proteobacteria bacterium]|nr:hypothetical protein [Pseudomonadota bacterium]
MPDITISVPAAHAADIKAALRESLGDDAEGLNDGQVARKALRRYVKGLVRTHRRRTTAYVTAAVTAAQDALVVAQDAATVATQARHDAEVADVAAVETAFGSES